MATKKKLLEAAAGSAGGAGLNVEEVFSTYLYTGTGSRIRIQNDVNVLNEGGLIWIKDRSASQNHYMIDTARGIYGVDSVTDSKYLSSNTTSAETSSGSSSSQVGQSNAFPAPAIPEDGFYINSAASVNGSGNDYASWTFRKAPKFFDVVTYTGTGSDQLINHNLGCVPGFVVVKRLSSTGSSSEWSAYHRSLPNTQYVVLNLTNSAAGNNARTVTDTQYMVHGNYPGENESGKEYVAYLWAHNNGDGEFGPNADQDAIKCGSFYFNGSATVNLGFEPQWILAKRTDSSSNGDWFISDIMRGWTVNTSGYPRERFLNANQSWQESLDSGGTNSYSNSLSWAPTSTGFKVFGYPFNNPGNYIYMAIRRGPMAVPENVYDAFDISYATNDNDASFPVDLQLSKPISGGNGYARNRLSGGPNYLLTDLNNAQLSGSDIGFDDMTGTGFTGWGTSWIHYNWRRAPSHFDIIAYDGNGLDPDTRSLGHNLGVTPEMCWIKCLSSAEKWMVWHKDLTTFTSGGKTYGNSLTLSDTTQVDGTGIINVSDTNETTLKLGFRSSNNTSGEKYIAYLFATLPGITKVGSYTGDGTNNSTHVIDCGFSNGAKFVLIKSVNTDSWMLFDSSRGIVSGNDPFFNLEGTGSFTSYDPIDPHSSGFIVNQETFNQNQSGSLYTFYAIAA